MIKVNADASIEVILNAWIANMANAVNQSFSYTKQGNFFLVSMISGDQKLPVAFVDRGGGLYEAMPRNGFENAYIQRGNHYGFIKTHTHTPV